MCNFTQPAIYHLSRHAYVETSLGSSDTSIFCMSGAVFSRVMNLSDKGSIQSARSKVSILSFPLATHILLSLVISYPEESVIAFASETAIRASTGHLSS